MRFLSLLDQSYCMCVYCVRVYVWTFMFDWQCFSGKKRGLLWWKIVMTTISKAHERGNRHESDLNINCTNNSEKCLCIGILFFIFLVTTVWVIRKGRQRGFCLFLLFALTNFLCIDANYQPLCTHLTTNVHNSDRYKHTIHITQTQIVFLLIEIYSIFGK